MLSKLSRLIQSLKSIQTDLVHAITDLEQCEGWVSVGDLIDQGVNSIQKIQLRLSNVTQDVAVSRKDRILQLGYLRQMIVLMKNKNVV